MHPTFKALVILNRVDPSFRWEILPVQTNRYINVFRLRATHRTLGVERLLRPALPVDILMRLLERKRTILRKEEYDEVR